MHKTEFCSMQRHSLGSRIIHRGTASRCKVDAFTTDRMPCLSHVDPNLMRAASFQSAFNQRVGVAKMFERRDMSHGPLAFFGFRRTPAAFAAVSHQIGLDRAGTDAAHADRQIATVGCVRPKLLGQNAFGRHGAGKDHQSARLTIQPVDGSHRRYAFGFLSALASFSTAVVNQKTGNGLGHHLVERGLNLPTPRRPAEFFGVSRGRHAGGFIDHHDLIIQMHNPHIVSLWRWCCGHRQNLDDLSFFQPAGNISAHIAMDQHMPRPHEFLHGRPTRALGVNTQKSCNRLPPIGGRDMMDCSWAWFHQIS